MSQAFRSLADDEADLGAAVIDMGGGTTTMAVFVGGRLVHVDGFAVGGNHVTMDIARGLNVRVADAERIKTLYGSCIAAAVGRARHDQPMPPQRATNASTELSAEVASLVRIIRPRVEEILEIVRDRLAASGCAAQAGRRRDPDRRRLPVDRACPSSRATIVSAAGARRPAARRRGAAGGGQESGVRRRGRVARLSASCGSRTLRAGAAERRARPLRTTGGVTRVVGGG